MDKKTDRLDTRSGIEIISNVIIGPAVLRGIDEDLIPCYSRLIPVISAGAINLYNTVVNEKNGLDAARRLCSLAALNACGELRALLILSTTGLSMAAGIHLRSIDECYKRITIYADDHPFALETLGDIPNQQADFLKKLSAEDLKRLQEKDDRIAVRVQEILASPKPPLKIKSNQEYKKNGFDLVTISGLSQVSHCTPLALLEMSKRISHVSDSIYDTDDAIQNLITAIGLGLSIATKLISLGLEGKNDIGEIENRYSGIIDRRSGLGGG